MIRKLTSMTSVCRLYASAIGSLNCVLKNEDYEQKYLKLKDFRFK